MARFLTKFQYYLSENVQCPALLGLINLYLFRDIAIISSNKLKNDTSSNQSIQQ